MITDIDHFDYDMIRSLPVLEAKKDERHIIDMVTAFDIEATRLPEIEQAVMYIWQFQFGPDITVIGRTWILHREGEAKTERPEADRVRS